MAQNWLLKIREARRDELNAKEDNNYIVCSDGIKTNNGLCNFDHIVILEKIDHCDNDERFKDLKQRLMKSYSDNEPVRVKSGLICGSASKEDVESFQLKAINVADDFRNGEACPDDISELDIRFGIENGEFVMLLRILIKPFNYEQVKFSNDRFLITMPEFKEIWRLEIHSRNSKDRGFRDVFFDVRWPDDDFSKFNSICEVVGTLELVRCPSSQTDLRV